MTTNSPNPVDGDVRARNMPALTQAERKTAIDSCVAEIAHLERCIKAHPDQPVLKVDLLVQQIALAALTAEPVAWTSQRSLDIRCKITAFTDVDSATDYGNKIRWESVIALYTTPPAQILRPLELPKSQRLDGNGYGYYFDMDDVFRALEKSGVPFKSQG